VYDVIQFLIQAGKF